MQSKKFKNEPLDLRPKRFKREDGGESVKHFLPMTEFKTSSSYWLKQLQNFNTVITLTGINPSVRVEDGYLSIQQGSTLADLQPETVNYGRGVHGISWIIIDSPNGFLTVDALRWLDSQRIGVMMVSSGEASILLQDVTKPIVSLRRRQYQGQILNIARWVLRGKLNTYLCNFPDLPNAEELHDLIQGNGLDNFTDVNDLRLVEGRIAGAYWKYHAFRLRTYKKFPTWWGEFNQRSSSIGTNGNRYASHPINAILNYAYAVIAGMLKRKCVMAGLDTAIGSLHADNDRRDSLCYDLLELLRGEVDKVLLTWAKSVKWRRTDFITSERGVVSLDNNLRRVVIEKITPLQITIDKIVKDYTLFLLLL